MDGTDTILFWVIATLIGAAIAALLVRPLWRHGAGVDSAENADIQVYKDQLAEVDRDIARGTLDRAEGDALKTEISRRLLAAAAQETGTNPAPGGLGVAVPLALVCAGLGLALYAAIGAPGAPDQPRAARVAASNAAHAARPSQAQMEARLASAGVIPDPLAGLAPDQRALLDQLYTVLEDRPDDLRGFDLLENFLADMGDWSGAATAQARIIAIKGDTATPADHLLLAEHLIFATNGYVSPEAEDALRQVLTLDPENGAARYFSGLTAAQAGRPDITYTLWSRLLSEGPPDAPWIAPIRSQIRDVALAAGQPVPELRGPSQEDVAAAGEMSAEDRAEMIRGMVAGLADRLAAQGGPAEDWAQLIRAYGVLGERAKANEILQEALSTFETSPADLDILRRAGRDAEVLQ